MQVLAPELLYQICTLLGGLKKHSAVKAWSEVWKEVSATLRASKTELLLGTSVDTKSKVETTVP